MRCSAVLVSVLVLFVCRSEGFKILKKLKDIIHPTTSTTTERVVPIVPDFEKGDAGDDSWSSESSEHHDWSVKSTTERVQKVASGKDKNTNGYFDTTSSTTSSFPDSHNLLKKEDFPTISPPSDMGVYPGAPRENVSSTTITNVNYQEQVFSTTELTFYDANKNHNQTSTQVNTPTNTYEREDDFEDANNCTANTKGRDYDQTRNQNNELKPGQIPSSIVCASGGNTITQDTSKQNNQDEQEGRIIFPDNPVLQSTQEPARSFDINRYEPAPSTTAGVSKDESVSSTTARTKKQHVPVAVDDGRRIIDAPSKDCGPGRKADENGRCRPVV